jgi:hypothetical protein
VKKFLLNAIANVLLSLFTGALSAWIFLTIDLLICAERNGQNAAGGGAAVGMLALFLTGVVAVVSFGWFVITDVRYDGMKFQVRSKIVYKILGAAVILLFAASLNAITSIHCLA